MEKNITQKKRIRDTIIQKRNNLSSIEIRKAANNITRTVIQIIENENYKTVLTYSHFRSEVPTDDIITYCLEQKICVGLPVSGSDHSMDFYKISSSDELISGYHGIPEPDITVCDLCNITDSSLMIVPGTAFDRNGRRLGYGGGFYDRYFLKYPAVNKIGIAYDLQIVDELPYEKHDIDMDMIITESGIIYKK